MVSERVMMIQNLVEIFLEYFDWTSDVATGSDLTACNIKYRAAFEGHSLATLVSQYSHQILILQLVLILHQFLQGSFNFY